MKTLRFLRLIPLLAFLALGACDDSGPTAIDDDELSIEDEIALQVIGDQGTIRTALDLVDAAQGAMGRQRMGGRMGRGPSSAVDHLREEARIHMEDARNAYLAGDLSGALEQARVGRGLIARALEENMGGMGIAGMVERMESLATTVPGDPDCYEDAPGLGHDLRALGQAARRALGHGDFMGAGQWGVLGEQRAHQGHRSFRGGPGQPGEEYVRLSVQLGATAVALAEEILTEQGFDEEQEDFLASAMEFQARAEAALEDGDLRAAVYFAGVAEWQALKAVVLPGGVTEAEVRAMIDLATERLAAARAAVGPDPTDLEAGLLVRAARMLENGEANVLQGNTRGIVALWRSAVISTWLIG